MADHEHTDMSVQHQSSAERSLRATVASEYSYHSNVLARQEKVVFTARRWFHDRNVAIMTMLGCLI